GGNAQGATNAGTYSIAPSGQTSTNYTITYVNGSLGITRAPLGIAADSSSKTYGSTPVFVGDEFTSTGLKNAETIGSVSLTSTGTAANAGVAGSPYAIVASAATGGTFNPANYTIDYVDGSLGITAAELGITANAAAKVYDGLAWSGGNGVSYNGFQGTDTATSLTGTLVYGGTSQGAINAGNYSIAPSGQTSANYTITYVNGSLGITPATLGIAANSSSKTYGTELLFNGTEFSSTGLQNAETIGSVNLTSLGASSTATVEDSPYAIVASAASGGSFNPANYTITYVDGSLGVIRAGLLGIAANSAVKVYDGLAWSGGNGVTYTGFLGGDTAADLTGTLSYGGTSQGAINAGSYTIIPSGQSSTNYTITYVNGSLSVTRAPLGIVANSSSKIYGSTPVLAGTAFTSTGLKNLETIGSVTLTSAGVAATAGVAGGPYAIVPSAATGGSFTAANYTITYVNGSLGVTPAALGIAARAAVKVYDGLAWSGGNGVIYTGLRGGDTAASLTGTLTYGGSAQGAANAGNYIIAPSGLSSSNYTISYVNGSLGVTRAPLGIVANSSSKTYGTTRLFTGSEFSSTGLKNAQTIGSVSLSSVGALASAGVAGGPYAIVASTASGGTFNPANYTISYVNGSLGVTPAALGIAANAAVKGYNGLAWSGGNGVTYTGLRGTDTAASLSGTLTYGGNSQGAINAGNYSLRPSGLSSPNYTITYVNGSLGITRAPLGIVANSLSKNYGSTLAFVGTEFSSTGLKNAESIGAVTLTSAGTAATADVVGSPYAIVASAASGGTFNAANYSISYVDGNLGVIPVGLLGVVANSAAKVYDGLAWSGGNGVTYSGFQGTDTAADLIGTLVYGGTSQGAINVGNYTIVPSGQSATNYTLSYINGNLGITAAALGIVANSTSKSFGVEQTFTGTEFTSTGLKNAETIGTVTLTSAGAAAIADVAGSPYAIVPSAAAGGSFNPTNYTISYTNGTLAVVPAGLLGIVANPASKVYDGQAWSGGNGVSYSGFQGADTAANLSGTLTYGGTSQGAVDVGNYTIMPSGQSSTNYTISYVSGNLGISAAPLEIIAD
ncbi:MAG: MBG domain-containing protein, partial [Gammaproteobacteria bacterium]|nr:MBG domain-containing protein [Gammaproteobacteria bacterium]